MALTVRLHILAATAFDYLFHGGLLPTDTEWPPEVLHISYQEQINQSSPTSLASLHHSDYCS